MASSQNEAKDVLGREEASQIRRKLVWRIGFAGLMIAGLLAGLALFDRLTTRSGVPESVTPEFSEPVPVPKKSITQALTPAEQREEKKEAAPEVTEAPADAATPPVAPAAPAELTRPSSAPRGTKPSARPAVAGPAPARPADHRDAAPAASGSLPQQASTPSAQAGQRPLAVLPRLQSGYALQAGVFADPRRAEELHARLVQEGIPATLETRVLVGPFRTHQEADAARAKMLVLGVDAVQLPRNGKK